MSAALDRLDLLLEVRRFDHALRECHRLLAQQPEEPDLWVRVMLAQAGLKQHAQALEAAQRVATLAPHSAIGHIGATEALMGLGRIDEAIDEAQRAVTLEPANMYAHVCLAESASFRKRHERMALAAANRAVSLGPNDADAHASLGAVAMRLGRGDVADTALRRALELDPTSHDVQHNLGVLRVTRGELVEGAHDLARSAAQNPNSSRSALGLQFVTLRWLQRTHIGMWVIWYVAQRTSIALAGFEPETYWIVRGIILFGLVVFLWWTRRTVVRVGGHLRRVVWTVMRRSRTTMVWFLAVAAGALGLLWAMLWPWSNVASGGLYLTGGALLAGCLASWRADRGR